MPSVDETEVNDFFHRHEHFQNTKWVKDHGTIDATEFLGDYKEKLETGYSVDYYFISTGNASQRVKDLAEECEENSRNKVCR